MPAPQIILDLIERFERNQDVYKSSAYNETQVRRTIPSASAVSASFLSKLSNLPSTSKIHPRLPFRSDTMPGQASCRFPSLRTLMNLPFTTAVSNRIKPTKTASSA